MRQRCAQKMTHQRPNRATVRNRNHRFAVIQRGHMLKRSYHSPLQLGIRLAAEPHGGIGRKPHRRHMIGEAHQQFIGRKASPVAIINLTQIGQWLGLHADDCTDDERRFPGSRQIAAI